MPGISQKAPRFSSEHILIPRHWFDEFGERSFHCGGSDKSTGQQSERPGDFHMGLISARQFSIFVAIDKELLKRGARVVVRKFESRRLSLRLSGREKLPVVSAEYR